VRLRSQFFDPQTSGHPRDLDTTLFFVDTDFEDSEISAFSNHSVWKYEYFLAGNTGSTPDATQHYTTRARALSLGELQQKGMAQLTAESLAELLARPSLNGQIRLPTDGVLTGIAFEVPLAAGERLPAGRSPCYQATHLARHAGTRFSKLPRCCPLDACCTGMSGLR
jgi:hypothetical protein